MLTMTVPKTFLILVTAALTASSSACSLTQPSQKAVTFPTVVGSVPPIQFVMEQKGDTFELKGVCQGTEPWQSIKLGVRTDTLNRDSSVESTAGNSCRSGNETVFSGLLFRADELEQGEKLGVYFDVLLRSGQGVKKEVMFTVGEGGKLYSETIVQ
jgi:hypothetical protein